MKATIKPNTEGTIGKYRKETRFCRQLTLVTVTDGQIEERLIVRFYVTAASTYCCVWLHDRKHSCHSSGGGRAGGYGYHRPSAALQDALDNAGITLDQPIDGRGDSAMNEALHAIAQACGDTLYSVIDAHA